MGKIVKVATDLAEKLELQDGFRLVMNNGERAGQTVFHLHLHLLGGRSMTWPPG
jgi:histidine triad (HIT) family protein